MSFHCFKSAGLFKAKNLALPWPSVVIRRLKSGEIAATVPEEYWLGDKALYAITMPDVDPFVAPILYAVPVQLLAYHTAVLKGTDVDQPRNLAKSVTVE